MLDLPEGWWPVAFGAEVGRHPARFVLDSQALAVYRDKHGDVRAVEDVCPHRRMPLSMGRITEEGHLQCAYHGWCFDGVTGRCTNIPNLSEGEKIKPNLRVKAFSTAEAVVDALGWQLRTSVNPVAGPPTGDEPGEGGTTMFQTQLADGFIMVWTGSDDVAPLPKGNAAPHSRLWGFRGQVHVRAPYEQVAQAVLWNPGRTLSLQLLLGGGDELVAPRVSIKGEAITVDRSRRTVDLPRPHGFLPRNEGATQVSIAMNAVTGMASIRASSEVHEARVGVALTPLGPYQTMVRWQADTDHSVAAALRRLASLRALPSRAMAAAHAMCDEADARRDPGLTQLRATRTSRATVPAVHTERMEESHVTS